MTGPIGEQSATSGEGEVLSVEENEALCRVGPGTLMGELLRRYWYPVSQAARHAQAGSVPERVRLLGEDLVLFRSSVGELGLLDEHCPHRGASLSLARNEDCGLRCLYHGWLVAPGGSVLDTPNEPQTSRSSGCPRALTRAFFR